LELGFQELFLLNLLFQVGKSLEKWVCGQICRTPDRSPWAKDDLGCIGPATPQLKVSLLLSVPWTIYLQKDLHFSLDKAFNEARRKVHKCIVMNSIYFHLYLKIHWEVIFFLCVREISKRQGRE
jgi:hypothetical protein